MRPAAPTDHPAAGFRFGVDEEFLLVDADNLAPLWHGDLRFDELNALLETIPYDDLPSCAALPVRPPNRKAMPFFVGGHLHSNDETQETDVVAKGVGIRTPAGSSPRHTLSVLRELRSRLADTLWGIGLRPVPLSHHPTARSAALTQPLEAHGAAPPDVEAMYCYALQLRIGLPAGLRDRLDLTDLHGKVRHYGPGLTAYSLAAPFCDDGVWDTADGAGKSRHISRHAQLAPALACRTDDGADLVFGALDASCRDTDIHAYMLLWLALLIDDMLVSRGTEQTYRRDMARTARLGFDDPATRARAGVLLDAAPAVLERWGFSATPLGPLAERLERRRCLADDYVDWYRADGTLNPVIEKLAVRARVRV